MNFENSKYSRLLDFEKFDLEVGQLYLTETNLVISEIKHGIHVNHDIVVDFFSNPPFKIDETTKYGYIANRINSYSIDPNIWADLNEEHINLVAAAIVAHDSNKFINATIEKNFFKKSLKRCNNIDQAIEWMMNLREFEN